MNATSQSDADTETDPSQEIAIENTSDVVAWLRDRDASCPICMYNLRDAPTAFCPECGAALTLSITSPNLQHGAWTLATSSFAMALGFDFVTLTLMVGIAILDGGGVPPQIITVMITLAFLAILSGAGLLSLIKDRRVFQRRPQRSQMHLAIGVFLGVFLLHAFGGFVIFVLLAGL